MREVCGERLEIFDVRSNSKLGAWALGVLGLMDSRAFNNTMNTTLTFPPSTQQATRTRALQHAYRRAVAAHPRENVPPPGTIRNLGLLGKEDDTRAVLGSEPGRQL